jgi:phospholipid/cholesterol/gamma-HCH transport system substrate-binding protein
MIKERHLYISIGTLVVLGFLSLFFLALKVSGEEQILTKQSSYNIKAEFNNIGQLKAHSKVSIAGVKIGRVKNITLDTKNFTAVVSIEIDKNYNKIPSDSELQILTAGLLGDQYLTIIPGFNENDFLHEGSVLSLSQTHSAIVLEDLLGKFLTSMQQKKGA